MNANNVREEIRLSNSEYCGLYIVEFEYGIKIGITKDYRERLKIYGLPWCQPIKSCYFLRCFNPGQVESDSLKALSKYISSRGSREYVSGVSIEHVKKVVTENKFACPKGTEWLAKRRKVYDLVLIDQYCSTHEFLTKRLQSA